MRYSGTDCALMCTAVPQKDTKVNSDFLIKVKKLIVINLVFPTFFLSLLLKEKVAPESLLSGFSGRKNYGSSPVNK